MPNWRQVLEEINAEAASKAAQSQAAIDTVRRNYLSLLHQYTGRNVIAYYSGFLSKPNIHESEINDEDKNGFMMAIHKLDRSKGLDLILHTQGGNIAATESIVDYLHKMFKPSPPTPATAVPDIRAIVPQIAMSAGTTTFLSQCENAIKWSNQFVAEQLEHVMFAGRSNAKQKAASVVRKLTDFRGNRTHERHIEAEECRRIGLDVDDIESDPMLQDLVLTVHHCFMHSLMNSTAYKVIENHMGAALFKRAFIQQ